MAEDTSGEIRFGHQDAPLDAPLDALRDVPARRPERPATGELRVDAALRMLDDLGELPIEAHPPVFERVHGQLVDVLGELRSGGDGDHREAQAPRADRAHPQR